MPTRRKFAGALVLALLARRNGAQERRAPRVALVFSSVPLAEMSGPDPVDPVARAFVHALRDLGRVDGRDIVIERRSAAEHERLPELMRELVASGVDLIVAPGAAAEAALAATDRIAIVGLLANALESGPVASLARPGRNFTAVTSEAGPMEGKRLQMLKELAPGVLRVAVIAQSPGPGPASAWRTELGAAARTLRLNLTWVALDTAADLDAGFAAIVRARADAVVVVDTAPNHVHRRAITEFTTRQRLPSVWPDRDFVEAGALMSYGTSYIDLWRRAAVYVDKILKGAKPGELPIEQPTRFELVLNLKTARALGITIPQSLLLRADEVIE